MFVYSPSQIETWQDCHRKWGLEKLDRLPKPQAKSAELGEAIHTQLESHLLGKGLDFTSKIPRWAAMGLSAELAATALHLLPPPGSVEVERKFDAVRLSDNPWAWTGRIDWMQLGPPITIGDHKSTSEIKAWAKSPQDLIKDVQANVYAKYALTHLSPHAESVQLQWTYIQTKGPKLALPVVQTLSRSQVESRFSEIDQIAAQITEARQQVKSGLELPYNPDTCEKYGGCPYQGVCNLSPLNRIKSIMAQNSDLANKLQQFQQFQPPTFQPAPGGFQPPSFQPPASTPSVPSFQPTPIQGATTMNYQGLSAIAKRNAEGKVIAALNGNPLPPLVIQTQYVKDPAGNGYRPIDPMDAQIAAWLEAAAAEYAAHPERFQDPAQPAPVAAPAAFQPPAPFQPQAQPQAAAWTPPGMAAPAAFQPPVAAPPGINPPEFQPPPQAVQADPAPAPLTQAVEPPKAKRGRPTKAEQEAKAAAQAAQTPAPWTPPGFTAPTQPAPAAFQAPEANAQSSQGSKGEGKGEGPGNDRMDGLTVYVDCFPVRGGGWVHSLDTFVADANVQIMQDEGLADYAFAEYGKGPGILASYVEAAIRKEAGQGAMSLYVNSRTREANACLNRIVAMAGTVIKGC